MLNLFITAKLPKTTNLGSYHRFTLTRSIGLEGDTLPGAL